MRFERFEISVILTYHDVKMLATNRGKLDTRSKRLCLYLIWHL